MEYLYEKKRINKMLHIVTAHQINQYQNSFLTNKINRVIINF